MTHYIEDALEVLAGLCPRLVNIKIDISEKNLITSVGRQVKKGIGLTDRQLSMVLNKFEKYRDGLTKNSVDVDYLIQLKPLKIPLRVIDRSQEVYITQDSETNKPVIAVKYTFSRKFAETWDKVEGKLILDRSDAKGFKYIQYNEQNIFHLVSTLLPLNFSIRDDLREIYEKISEIMENPEKTVPFITEKNGKLTIENASQPCLRHFNEKFSDANDNNFLNFISEAKNCGIFLKSTEIAKKIQEFQTTDIVKKIITTPSSRLRINPEKFTKNEILDSIKILNQLPVLIVVEEDKHVIPNTNELIELLLGIFNKSEINVFFRLKNEKPECIEFNQNIKNLGLNNYIDSSTRVVIVSKNRIPKPLLSADWHPRSAIVFSSNDFGKLSSFLNDVPNVYYYNDSLSVKHCRIKGSSKIVEL